MKLLKYYTFFFFIFVIEIWYVFQTYSTCQLGLAALQMLKSHLLLVATILDSAATEYMHLKRVSCVFYFATSVIFGVYIFHCFYHLILFVAIIVSSPDWVALKEREMKQCQTIQWLFFRPWAVWQ